MERAEGKKAQAMEIESRREEIARQVVGWQVDGWYGTFADKILEIYAVKKSYAKNLSKEAEGTMSLGRAWINETFSKEELALWRRTCQCQAESDQEGSSGRLVWVIRD